MLVRRMQPVTAMSALGREFDRLFETLWSSAGGTPTNTPAGVRVPAINAWRESNQIIIELEAPGFTAEEISVEVADDQLVIEGTRAADTEASQPERSYLRRERLQTGFHRTLPLPAEVDREKIGASLNNGVMRITMPLTEAVQPRRIEVRNGSN